jgi:Rrf2 family protein
VLKFTKSIELVDYWAEERMRLSTKGEYASRAMLELSLHHEEKPLHIRDISKAQDIPQRFLEQILLQLKRAGYLRSRKGPDGGYYLSRPPAEINVAEVIRVMDGPLAPIDCVSVTAHEVCPHGGPRCGRPDHGKSDFRGVGREDEGGPLRTEEGLLKPFVFPIIVDIIDRLYILLLKEKAL